MYRKHTNVRSFVRKVLGSWHGAWLFFPALLYSTRHILSKPPAYLTLLSSDSLWGRNRVLFIFVSLRVPRMEPNTETMPGVENVSGADGYLW